MKLPCCSEGTVRLISLAAKKKWPKLCLTVACVSHETSFFRIIINFHIILKYVFVLQKKLIVTVVFYRNFLLGSGTVWAHLPICNDGHETGT